MTSPNPASTSASQICRYSLLLVLIAACVPFIACTKVTKGEAEKRPIVAALPAPPAVMLTWLGAPSRNSYGTGPWKEGELTITWEMKTGATSGRLHKDPWGGTSWPGQPSVEGDRVYFPSADGNAYALRRSDGTEIWKFKGKDSFKATPTIAGDRIIASGLDHHVYCLSKDGKLLWDHETGFEVDGAAAIVNDKVYFGGEDHYLYCLNLSDGALVYKTLVGSVEGSITFKDDRIYLCTEEGDLFCMNPADGSVIWKARIGADSDSTPAVVDGVLYTAAEDGVVRAYKAATGELLWNYVTEGSHLYVGNEKRGIWGSPVVYKDRIYIGASNGYLHCLNTKGELVWRYKAHAAIWGTSPVVDGRVVFGDKAGWLNMISAEDGKLISEIKIGDNVNSTPAIVDGQIYIGAFNGKLYRLDMVPKKPKVEVEKPIPPTRKPVRKHKRTQ